MVILWAGYSFSRDYNTPRGHHHCIEDLRKILRTGSPGVDGQEDIQPGTCWTCKGPDVPRLMREKGTDKFYAAKWSDWGPEVMNTVGAQTAMMQGRWNFVPLVLLSMRHGLVSVKT